TSSLTTHGTSISRECNRDSPPVLSTGVSPTFQPGSDTAQRQSATTSQSKPASVNFAESSDPGPCQALALYKTAKGRTLTQLWAKTSTCLERQPSIRTEPLHLPRPDHNRRHRPARPNPIRDGPDRARARRHVRRSRNRR